MVHLIHLVHLDACSLDHSQSSTATTLSSETSQLLLLWFPSLSAGSWFNDMSPLAIRLICLIARGIQTVAEHCNEKFDLTGTLLSLLIRQMLNCSMRRTASWWHPLAFILRSMSGTVSCFQLHRFQYQWCYCHCLVIYKALKVPWTMDIDILYRSKKHWNYLETFYNMWLPGA